MAQKVHFPQVAGNASVSSSYGQSAIEPVGNVYYVDSTNAKALDAINISGYSPEAPFATLNFAMTTAATANNGDVVKVMPGHTESITSATAATWATAGVTVIGMGYGSLRPQITFSSIVGATINITAANISITNVAFNVGIDNLTAMVNVSAADVGFYSCQFFTNTATLGAAIGILTAATATRFTVQNCAFMGPAVNTGTTTTAQIDHEVGVDYVIRDNLFTGKMTQAITNGTTVLRGLIFNNQFIVFTGTKAINMAAASTPAIGSNRINVPSGTTPIVAAAGFIIGGNTYAAAAGVTAGAAITW